MSTFVAKLANVLLVEDSEDDAFLFRHGLAQTGLGLQLQWMTCVREAIAYLEARDAFSDRHQHPFPDVIFTDLKMPEMDGFAFLEWLKQRPHCSVVPTVVLSASFHDTDVLRCYELGANAFISKPSAINDLVEILQATCHFWSKCQRPKIPLHEKC